MAVVKATHNLAPVPTTSDPTRFTSLVLELIQSNKGMSSRKMLSELKRRSYCDGAIKYYKFMADLEERLLISGENHPINIDGVEVLERRYTLLPAGAAVLGAKYLITLESSGPVWQLQQWKLFIDELIAEHGPRSILFTDAGHNNVSLVIDKRP